MVMNALRQGAKSGIAKFILMGFMVMAVAGLVLMDMGGFFRGGVSRPNVVASVDGEQLQTAVFDRTVRRTLSQQGLDTAIAYQLGFIHQILNSEINRGLLYSSSNDLGIQIGQDMIVGQINQFLEPLVTANLSRREALERFLQHQGMSESQFVQALRMEIANSMLRNAIQLSSAYTPEAEARLLYQHQGEERTVEAVVLPGETITGYQEPTDDILLPFYQAGPERYAIPETRTITLALLGMENLEATIDVSDEELRKIYEDEIEGYRVPERRQMTQAVLQDQATARAVADKVGKENLSLEEAVKKVTGSADAYLGEDVFEESGLVDKIAQPAFAANKGAVIGPVETPLGWHVLVVRDILPPATRSFAEVRDQLRRDIVQDRLADQMYATAGAIDDRLASGTPLEEVAENFDLTLKKYGPLRADGSTPDQKEGIRDHEEDRAYILQTAFELTESESSPVFEMADGNYGVVRVDTVTPKSYKPFEEVRDDLAGIWIADQKDVLNRQRAQEAFRAAAAGEKTLEEIAQAYNVTVQTLTLKRSGDLPEGLTQASRADFLATDQGEYTMSDAINGYVVGKVTGITLPEAGNIPEEALENIRETVSQRTQGEYFTAYMQWLRTKHNVKINDRLLETMYGPGSER